MGLTASSRRSTHRVVRRSVTIPQSAARTPDDATGLAWSSQHEADGRVTWICPTCTRAQLWLIEAGLTIATAHAPARAVPLPSAA